MTGGKNVLKYITTEGKRTGKKTALEYLQKSTGVFNGNGMLEQSEVAEMKNRLAENKGNIWHGFISLSEEDSHKIDNPDKCIELIKNTFNSFLKEAHLAKDNIDLMCALHLDKPHHLHIHFVFWEKEARYKDKNGNLNFRNKGKIDKKAIDNIFVRLGLFIDESSDSTYKSRDNAIRELREMTNARRAMKSSENIKKEIIVLAKELPKTGRLSYGSKDMESYRGRVDKIVQMLLDYDGKAQELDNKFHQAIADKKRKIANICNSQYLLGTSNVSEEKMTENLPKYNNNIDIKNIRIIEELESDYKRRQGNLVINLAKFIKPELYERKKGKKYKANDNRLKRSLSMSSKKIGSLFDNFINSFFSSSQLLERDYTNRLEEIEKEMEEEKKKEANGKR